MPTKALSSTGLSVERPRSNPKGKLGQNQHSQPTCNMPNKPTENKTYHFQNLALAQEGGPGTKYHAWSFTHLPHGVHPTPQGSGCHTGVETKAQSPPTFKASTYTDTPYSLLYSFFFYLWRSQVRLPTFLLILSFLPFFLLSIHLITQSPWIQGTLKNLFYLEEF